MDNASSDATCQLWDSLPAEIRSIRNAQNLGFARACNQGAQAAHGKHLVFLNNDTQVTTGWLEALLQTAHHPSTGIVGSKLLYPDGRIQHAGIGFINGLPDHPFRFAAADAPEVNQLRELDMVTGACLIIKRNLFLRLGGFDEIYQNGVEDVDLCLRAREAGYSVLYQPASVVYHHEGKSKGRFDKVKQNLQLFFQRWHNRFDKTGRFITASPAKLVPAESSMILPKRGTRIDWQGSQFVYHSLALVNRQLCLQLIERGYDMTLTPYESDQFDPKKVSEFKRLAKHVKKKLSSSPDIIVRHKWPPDFSVPASGHLVMIQPWEFGSLPLEWISPITTLVDEVWVPTSFVRDCYISSGVAAERVHVVPNGVDTRHFNPQAKPLALKTNKSFRFLFVGGTIYRKGIDLLLAAYGKSFSAMDDVCLVIKDMGVGSFYRGQTAQDMINRFRENPGAPEIEYIDQTLTQIDIPRLYTACNCLVHPYRGEGFGLPIAEAMACGRAAIVTGYGAALDFCSEETGWLLKATPILLPEKRIGDLETVDHPWLAEPDLEDLVRTMQIAASVPAEVRRRGDAAAQHIAANFSWETATDVMEIRIETLLQKPVLRHESSSSPPKNKHVSLIIRAGADKENLRQCIQSIQRNTTEPCEIFLISKDSLSPGVGNEMPRMSKSTSFIPIDGLQGVAACNAALRTANSEFLCIMDDTVRATPGWLDGLIACLESTPDAGIIGPMSLFATGTQQIQPRNCDDSLEFEKFSQNFRNEYHHRRIPNRQLNASCLMFRSTLIEEIGLLDEELTDSDAAYADFCIRAELAGCTNLVAGDVLVGGTARVTIGHGKQSHSRKLFQEKWSKPTNTARESKQIAVLKSREKAGILQQRGEYESALDVILKEGIPQAPDELRLYQTLAELLLDQDRPKDAYDALMQAPADNQNAEQHVLLGRALAGMGSTTEAVSHGEEALRISPGCAPARHLLATIAHSQDQIEQAVSLWQRTITSDPGYGAPYTGLGVVSWNKGEVDNALDLLEKGALLSPLSTEAVIAYHTAICETHTLQRGELLLKELSRCYPQHRRIAFLLIDLLIRQERIDEALKVIERSIATFGFDDAMLAAGMELRSKIGPLAIPHDKAITGSSVSLCMIIKNEEKNLARCLQSLKPIVDEIIIVDTGSTDRSKILAELFGAKLIEHPWDCDFSAARNAGLEHAAGQWIFIMDADEAVSPLDYETFLNTIEGAVGKNMAFDVVTRNYLPTINTEQWQANDGHYPDQEAGGGWTPSNKVRIFPNLKTIRFVNPIHEMVDNSLRHAGISISKSAIPIHHYGYLNTDRQQEKGEQYYLLGKMKLEKSGDTDSKAFTELAIQAGGIGRYEEAIELWDKVLGLVPDLPFAYFNLGFVNLQLGRFTESRNASAKAMKLNKAYYEAVNNYAMAELCLDNPCAAIKVLKKTLKAKPEYPKALAMLAVTHLYNNKIDDGIKLFRKLSDYGVVFVDFINESVLKLISAHKIDEARTIIKTALAHGYGNEKTHEISMSLQQDK